MKLSNLLEQNCINHGVPIEFNIYEYHRVVEDRKGPTFYWRRVNLKLLYFLSVWWSKLACLASEINLYLRQPALFLSRTSSNTPTTRRKESLRQIPRLE